MYFPQDNQNVNSAQTFFYHRYVYKTLHDHHCTASTILINAEVFFINFNLFFRKLIFDAYNNINVQNLITVCILEHVFLYLMIIF